MQAVVNQLMLAGAVCAYGLAAFAMPTRDELIQAQKIVEDLTADDVRALKTGAKKAGEVAIFRDAQRTIWCRKELAAAKRTKQIEGAICHL